MIVGGKFEGSIPEACDSCIYTGQRKKKKVKDPEKWNNVTPGAEGRTCLWQRSWGGRVAVWTPASPHAVGGFFIMVLHWMSRLALCFLICSAPTRPSLVPLARLLTLQVIIGRRQILKMQLHAWPELHSFLLSEHLFLESPLEPFA